MDDSVLTIAGYVFNGWQAKAIFCFWLFSIFAFGYVVGHHVGANKVITRMNQKIDSLESK